MIIITKNFIFLKLLEYLNNNYLLFKICYFDILNATTIILTKELKTKIFIRTLFIHLIKIIRISLKFYGRECFCLRYCGN